MERLEHHSRFELTNLYPDAAYTTSDPYIPDINHGIADLVNSGNEIEVVETTKGGVVSRLWLHSSSHRVTPIPYTDGRFDFFHRSLRGWRKVLFNAFLPVGYPTSVSSDYVAYQTYDSLQAFFSTITSLLANRALLQGLGVGDANSSATFAMLLTILKDAVSRVATIVFAHRFGLSIEPEAKRYRFLADLFNDTAFFLELYSPYFGSWGKVAALCTGEALRAICGVAAGASKAALSLHFAKQDNLSELNAKEASQETAVGLIGLLVGTIVVRVVEDHRAVVYLMIALVFAHLWMNYKGVRCVEMNTLNKQRATILFDWYMNCMEVWTPKTVAEEERILFWDGIIRNANEEPVCRIDFSTSYGDAMGPARSREEVIVVDGPVHTRFIRPYAPGRLAQIKILMWDEAEAKHVILAWFMAMENAWFMEKGVPYGNARKPDSDRPSDGQTRIIDGVNFSARDELLWDKLGVKSWDLETGVLETGGAARLNVRVTRKKAE
ncbi:Diphosphomevalonate decarboxylase [Tolypocladium paradoxum]|uniref:Diphosphomevalonate decarboxylase n=1 Tax=Tolypocladium paradoxum TaxID=94208 RepID=A0A2S4L9M0_9HYPO|nr:Diphosphomevalonate decarboxylase [Tolypocladium paradoxum]